jgi:uncharacterized protein (DUF433 family)
LERQPGALGSDSPGWRLLEYLTAVDWHELFFVRSGAGACAVLLPQGDFLALPRGQGVMEEVLGDLSQFLADVRMQWTARQLEIADFPQLVSDAAILGGSPIIRGTRIETAFVANLSLELSAGEIRALFPYVSDGAIDEAALFEGIQLAA